MTAPVTSSKLLLQSKHISVSKSTVIIFQHREGISSCCKAKPFEPLTAPTVRLFPHWPVAATSGGLPTPLPAWFVCSSVVRGLWGWCRGWHTHSRAGDGGRVDAANCWCYFPFLEEHMLWKFPFSSFLSFLTPTKHILSLTSRMRSQMRNRSGQECSPHPDLQTCICLLACFNIRMNIRTNRLCSPFPGFWGRWKDPSWEHFTSVASTEWMNCKLGTSSFRELHQVKNGVK